MMRAARASSGEGGGGGGEIAGGASAPGAGAEAASAAAAASSASLSSAAFLRRVLRPLPASLTTEAAGEEGAACAAEASLLVLPASLSFPGLPVAAAGGLPLLAGARLPLALLRTLAPPPVRLAIAAKTEVGTLEGVVGEEAASFALPLELGLPGAE